MLSLWHSRAPWPTPRPTRGLLRIAALLAGVLAAPIVLSAQQPVPASISGTVLAADALTPMAEALVELVEGGWRVRTDARGRYSFEKLPAGTHTMRVLLMGYDQVQQAIVLTPGDRVRLDLLLTRSAVEIDPLRVLAARTRMASEALGDVPMAGAAHVISRDRIASPDFVFGNVHDLLRTVPGVNLQEEDGYGLRPNIGLRGSGTERSSKITLMEDGVLIAPAPYAAPAAYYFPTVPRMHAVEVRTGSSQVRYGPRTTGGALNLVSTPIPESFDLALEASGGPESTLRTQGRIGSSGRHAGWIVEGYRVETNGFKELQSGAGTGFLIQDYVAKLRLNTDRTARLYQQLEVKAGYNDERSDETYLGLTDADFAVNPLLRYPASEPDVMKAEQTQVQVRHFLNAQTWDLTTTLYRNDFQRNWYKLQSVLGTGLATVLADPEAHPGALAILKGGGSADNVLRVRANNREYYSQGIQSTFGARLAGQGLRHNLELGIRVHRDEEDRFEWEDGFRMVQGRMEQTSAGAPGSQANRVGTADAVAGFVQDEISAGRWSVTPGLRYETVDFTRTDYAGSDPDRTTPTRVRTNGVTVWIPGLSVTTRAAPGLDLFAGLHRGFGPPGPGADELTRPERSWNYEVGVRLNRPGVSAQLSAYVTDYSNILGAATLANSEDGSGDAFNGGSVLVQGLEAKLEWDLAARRSGGIRLPVSLTYSYIDAQFRSAFESDFDSWGKVEIGDQLPYVATSQLFASLGVAHRLGRLSASLTGSTPMRTQAGQGPRDPSRTVDGFITASVSGEWHLYPGGTLFAALQNLTDTRYSVARRPAGLRPGLPRTLLAGIRLAT